VRKQTAGTVICNIREWGNTGMRETLAREEAQPLFVLFKSIRTPYNVLQGGLMFTPAKIARAILATPGKIANFVLSVIVASGTTLIEIYPLYAKLPLTP